MSWIIHSASGANAPGFSSRWQTSSRIVRIPCVATLDADCLRRLLIRLYLDWWLHSPGHAQQLAITVWEKYNLPHIYAYRFRYSMASVLYFSGADVVSISKRLGHAQVSTTQDMYAHLIKQADTQSAERIADAIFRSNKKSGYQKREGICPLFAVPWKNKSSKIVSKFKFRTLKIYHKIRKIPETTKISRI